MPTKNFFRPWRTARNAANTAPAVQSGSDRVLKAMNRGYTRSDYFRLAELARQLMPDLVLTTDIIVGLPWRDGRGF
jgi:tRNA-2-methylthio-N6-dimethylallyladenosine synthase